MLWRGWNPGNKHNLPAAHDVQGALPVDEYVPEVQAEARTLDGFKKNKRTMKPFID